MRSPARLVTGTAAAALTAVALGLATAPSAYAEGAVERPESSAWPVVRTDPGTDAEAGSVAGTALGANPDTDPGAESGLETDSELTETELTETELTETELTETELTETELTGADPAETGLGTGARPGTSPRPEPVEPPPGTKPAPVRPSASPTGTWPERPSGHVRTGVGGSAGPDTTQLVAGAGVLGAAAVTGVRLLRRRRTDGAQHG
ncbi:pentapeptide repeat-containing protein [Streptomyces sp. NPDC058637]|uniref:pentapeptide repeat-containing protein n=1 Tax=Streptomyces sp. NPDC058637 TaxID=3346569 RepID=UPI0036647F26